MNIKYTCSFDEEMIYYDTREEAEQKIVEYCEENESIFNEWLDENINSSKMLALFSCHAYDYVFDRLWTQMIEDFFESQIHVWDIDNKRLIYD